MNVSRVQTSLARALLLGGLSVGSVACDRGSTEVASRCCPVPERISPAPSANPALSTELSAMIPGLMRADAVPGLNVLVIEGGETTWVASFGWADVESERPMTADAIFRVESISKPVTAWGVMELAESGVLDLDEPLQAQLRSWALPTGAESLTPRRLLSHTAGVGLGDYEARYAPEGSVPTLQESLDAELTLVGPPGDAFSYSDTGYNLLELLVQDLTGEDFGRWMHAHVLGPLGMTQASFDWDPTYRGRMPIAHTLGNRPVEPYVYPGRGSGGLFATIRDVGRFVEAGMAPVRTPVLADSSVTVLHTPVVRPGGLYGLVAQGYGLGHFTETLSDGRRALWHGGQGHGWMTHFHMVPETGDAIVLLANSQRAWPLFGHVLRAWSGSIGVEPVRMARITWGGPLAWIVIVICAAAAAMLAVLTYRRTRRRAGPGTVPAPPLPLRIGALLAGLGLFGVLAWASAQEYLFLFSILPATTVWLGLAAAALAAGLLGWALTAGPATARGARACRTLLA